MIKTLPSPILTGNDQVDTLHMKELLFVAGLQQTDVARDLGVKKTIVNQVILRKAKSARVLAYFENLIFGVGIGVDKLSYIRPRLNGEISAYLFYDDLGIELKLGVTYTFSYGMYNVDQYGEKVLKGMNLTCEIPLSFNRILMLF